MFQRPWRQFGALTDGLLIISSSPQHHRQSKRSLQSMWFFQCPFPEDALFWFLCYLLVSFHNPIHQTPERGAPKRTSLLRTTSLVVSYSSHFLSLSLSIDYIYLGFHFLVIFYSGCGSVWCNFSSEAGVRKIRMYVPWCMILWVNGFWFFTLNQFCLALLSLIVSVYRRWQWLFDGPITQWEFVVLLLILDWFCMEWCQICEKEDVDIMK